MYTLAVRADPGGTVGNAPFVFSKTFRTDFKTAGTSPAEGLTLFTAVAGVPFFPTPAASFFCGLRHAVYLSVHRGSNYLLNTRRTCKRLLSFQLFVQPVKIPAAAELHRCGQDFRSIVRVMIKETLFKLRVEVYQ